jgi:hypothetical protein
LLVLGLQAALGQIGKRLRIALSSAVWELKL